MAALPNHTALKEWSTVVEALGRGEQVILIRKGGIADPSFGVEADRFYLYPTYFHQGENEASAAVEITHWCEVVRTWTLTEHEQLARVAPLVKMPPEALETRYRFRPDQALFVIAVRTWELPERVTVPFDEAYGGCRSWISLEVAIDVDGSRVVLGEESLASKIAEVAGRLAAGVPVA